MNLRPLAPLFLALLAGCSQQPPLRGSGTIVQLPLPRSFATQVVDGQVARAAQEVAAKLLHRGGRAPPEAHAHRWWECCQGKMK